MPTLRYVTIKFKKEKKSNLRHYKINRVIRIFVIYLRVPGNLEMTKKLASYYYV